MGIESKVAALKMLRRVEVAQPGFEVVQQVFITSFVSSALGILLAHGLHGGYSLSVIFAHLLRPTDLASSFMHHVVCTARNRSESSSTEWRQ